MFQFIFARTFIFCQIICNSVCKQYDLNFAEKSRYFVGKIFIFLKGEKSFAYSIKLTPILMLSFYRRKGSLDIFNFSSIFQNIFGYNCVTNLRGIKPLSV